MNQKAAHNKFTTKIVDENIFYLHFLPNTDSTAEDYQYAYQVYNELRNSERLYVIIEIDELATMDQSAREYLQKNKFEALAAAVILRSLPQRIIYNFYIKIRQQDYPMKSFHNFEQAKKWIDNLKVTK